jgi:hypothetical protein
MVKQSTVQQFLDLIESVFNYSSKDRVAIAFLAKEAARQRAAVAFKPNAKNHLARSGLERRGEIRPNSLAAINHEDQ